MVRILLMFALTLLMACAPQPDQPPVTASAETIGAKFEPAWLVGTVLVDATAQRALRPTLLSIKLRLVDPVKAHVDLDVGTTGQPCRTMRLLYRESPTSEVRLLQLATSDTYSMYSSAPISCFFVGTEWTWNVILTSPGDDSFSDANFKATRLWPGQRSRTEAIRIVVTGRAKTQEQFYSPKEIQMNAVAMSDWIPLAVSARPHP